MTDRIPLDHLTSDALDALYEQLDQLRAVARGYCPACGRGDAAPTVTDWEQQRRRAARESARASQAEQRLLDMTLNRDHAETQLQQLADAIRATLNPAHSLTAALDRLAAALPAARDGA